LKQHYAAALLLAGCRSRAAPSPSSWPSADTIARGVASAGGATEASDASITASTGERAPTGPIGDALGERAAPSATQLAPLTSEGTLVPLEVAGWRPATVAVPVGATGSRPVVLALHGNFDRPEWQCDVWRTITRGHAFVLCPRGETRPDAPPPLDRWTYGRAADVRREIDAALAALHARYGAYVDAGDVIYAGFSLGAILGVAIVSQQGARFPRAVLIEGGHSGWSRERALAYAAAGGKRVLFACGQPGCRGEAALPAKLLGASRVETRVVYGGNAGHAYDGVVARAVEEALPWLVSDDPRWAAR